MVTKRLFLTLIIFIISGCVSKRKIQLESLSIVSRQKVEKSYLTQKYVKATPFNSCVIKINQRFNQPNEISDKFLKIVFSSKEKVFFSYAENKGQPPYIHFLSDKNKLTNIGLCPLVKIKNKGYVNTIYYPISIKDSFSKKFNLKESKRFSFYLKTTGYSKWETNEIVITKDMIDKLKF